MKYDKQVKQQINESAKTYAVCYAMQLQQLAVADQKTLHKLVKQRDRERDPGEPVPER